MIEPELKDDAFLADVEAARPQRDALHMWWLGQSGFLVLWRDSCLLLDPYLSDSLTKKYAGTDKPHVRMTTRVIAPERLDFVRVATSSHNHTDHLDAETLLPLRQANPGLALIIPEANRAFVAERLRCEPQWPIGLSDGQSVECAGFRFTAVPAAHETVALGYVVQAGPWRIYHSGDTVLYQGMAERLRPFAVDVALLPINGRLGNLNGTEAARLAHAIGAKLVVPCHYEMFEFNTASPEEFVAEAARLRQPCRVLRCGERLILAAA